MTSPLILLILCLIAAAAAVKPGSFFGRPQGALANAAFHLSSQDAVTLYEGQTLSNFSQKFDHFDPLDTKKWDQRFYYNARFSNKDISSGQDIIFLMVGGEGEEGPKWSGDENVQIMQYAKLFGATVMDLEHRFFGPSRPIDDMKLESLRLLTVQQALADLAYFITSMNKEHKYENPKWITFGGSYPGSLSALFRSKYPELTAGAVASSATLNLKLDFYQYADIVQSVMSQTPITNDANESCDGLVRRAISQMQSMSQTKEGRKKLNEQMHIVPPFGDKTDKRDINNFFLNVYSIFQGMIQYTYDGSSDKTKYYKTARQACDIMNKGGDLVDIVWELAKFESNPQDPTNQIVIFANNYTADVEWMSQTNYEEMGESAASSRGWFWLSCNERGLFQTTDGDSIFGSTIPINLYYEQCTEIFAPEVNASYVRDANSVDREWYSFDDFDATNLCLPSGKFDPWSPLGYYEEDKTRNIVPVVIEGAAHCSDMYPEYEGEPAALPAARQRIRDFLSGIIYDADHPQKSASSLSITLLLASTLIAALF